MHLVKITAKGVETMKPLDTYTKHDRFPYLRVPSEIFNRWFTIRYNSKNAPYHVFRGRGFNDMVMFLAELAEYYKPMGERLDLEHGRLP